MTLGSSWPERESICGLKWTALGLFIEATLPDTTLARDTWTLVQMAILDGMSYSFYADRWETDTDKKQDRILHITDLPEVSLVTFPAYQASVAIATEQRDEHPAGAHPEAARTRAEAETQFHLINILGGVKHETIAKRGGRSSGVKRPGLSKNGLKSKRSASSTGPS